LGETAAFVDRDGTVCEHVPYLSTVAEFELLPTVADGIRRLNRAGVEVVVVTNQSGIGRGYFTRAEADAVNAEMRARLAARGADLTDVYLCGHHPDAGCDCRKPAPGLLLAAAADHGIALEESYVVGDRASDVEAGRRVGCTTILFPSPETARDPAAVAADHTVESFAQAAEIVRSGTS
jgi:D-glycero-D-manno-heptose 1,7-bisphosphate phosphatase